MALQKIPFQSGIDVDGDSNIRGNMDVDGKVYDIDGQGNKRNISDLLDTLAQTVPQGYNSLSSGEAQSTIASGKASDAQTAGYDYSIFSIGDTLSVITFGDVNYFIGLNSEFSHANTGTLRLLVNGTVQDSVDLTQYSPDGTGTAPVDAYPASGIQISKLEKHPNFANTSWADLSPQYARGEAKSTIIISWLRPGSNTIRLEHVDNTVMLGSVDYNCFYDDYTQTVSIINTSLSINTASNTVYLSGVPFAGNGTSLNVDYTATNYFGGTYGTDPLFKIENTQFGISDTFDYTAGTGYTTPNPVIGESIQISRVVTVNSTSQYTDENTSVTVFADTNNPARNAPSVIVRGSNPIRIMTGGSSSADNLEDFRSETYRIPVASVSGYESSLMDTIPTGLFNSSASLGSGELQVAGGKLIYPQNNYTATSPSGPDYSTFGGVRSYIRAINGFSPAEAGGVITLEGIDRSFIDNGSVKVEIKMPGVSAWGDLASEYLDPVSADGMGCWYPAAGDGTNGQFGFFLGYNFANGGSANAILIKITINEAYKSSVEILKITTATIS